jgi:hypothetical protein
MQRQGSLSQGVATRSLVTGRANRMIPGLLIVLVLQIHDLKAQLLYMPVYIAHYQHGDRYKHGTDSVIIPQMFYAAISGLSKGMQYATGIHEMHFLISVHSKLCSSNSAWLHHC